MQHGKKNRKFGRETKQRKALLRDLTLALITNKKITTTQAKAKSLRPFIEKLITKGKANNLAAFKTIASQVGTLVAKKLTQEIGPGFAERSGGYTRIRNLPPRLSDGSKMAIIELVS
ncbi:MAG: 50S ribosomal protein L17 [Candidatus Yanofskybacteria bacterium]|nr:50S ribosomal protein L17 [Candidatus Yanofskybacteria bacterium]